MIATESFVRFNPIVKVFTIPSIEQQLEEEMSAITCIGESRYEQTDIDPTALCVVPRKPMDAPISRFFKVVTDLLYEHIQTEKEKNPGRYLDPVLEYVNTLKMIAREADSIHSYGRINTIWETLSRERRHEATMAARYILACAFMDEIEYIACTIARYVNDDRVQNEYRIIFRMISEQWLLEKVYSLSYDTIVDGELSNESREKYSSYIFSYFRIVKTCLNAIESGQTTADNINNIVYELFTTIYDEPRSESKMVRDVARETLGYVQNIRIKCPAITYLFTLLDDNRAIAGHAASKRDRHFLFDDLYESIYR